MLNTLISLLPFFHYGSAQMFVNNPTVLVTERADPIQTPGMPFSHVHTIFGGNKFGMETDYDKLQTSTCVTSNFEEDFSAYWVPEPYWRWKNGTYTPINRGAKNVAMNVYYFSRAGNKNKSEPVYAFPPGFRMIAGDTTRRTFNGTAAEKAVTHRCYGVETETPKLPPASAKCNQFIRSQVYFPSCWNGELDSDDHKSHVVYPIDEDGNGVAGTGGYTCPDTHPKRLVTIFFEVFLDMVNDEWNWYEHLDDAFDQDQPIVFSNGDTTGYGFHGDFMNGWADGALQTVVDNCSDGTPCDPKKYLTEVKNKASCTISVDPLLADDITGVEDLHMVIDHLPGRADGEATPDDADQASAQTSKVDTDSASVGDTSNRTAKETDKEQESKSAEDATGSSSPDSSDAATGDEGDDDLVLSDSTSVTANLLYLSLGGLLGCWAM